MTTVSGVTSNSAATTPATTPAAPTANTGSAQDVSGLMAGNINLSMADAVTSKVQPYLDRATTVQTSITTNQTTINAYVNMQVNLQALQSAAADLSSQAVAGTNVFNARVANLSSNSAISASSILSASVASGTTPGNHSIIVNSLAAAESDLSAEQNFSSTTALGLAAGSFTIAEQGKASPVSVSVSATMSLTDIASAINGAASQNGVTASVVSIDSSHSVLVLSGSDTNAPLSFSDPNGVLAGLGVYGNSATLTGTTSETSSATALGLAGSFTIGGGTDGSGSATAVPVTVTSTMSLTDIMNAINTAATTAGVANGFQASVTGSNQLQITTGNGNPVSFSGVSGNVLSSLGVQEQAANGAANQVQNAQAANLTVDGVAGITRSTNTISDVLSGVTLNLTQASPSTTVTIGIAPDTTAATNAIQSFVTAYNNWNSFVSQNEATNSDGTAASGAVLFGDSTLRQASLSIDSSLTGMINNMTLADMGISLDSNNNLQVDSTTLGTTLADNFTGVTNLFQSTVSTSAYTLQTLGTDYSSFAGSFTLGITTGGGNITGLTMNGSPTTNFTFSGNTITGASGTPYSGMSFSYTGTGETVTVSATQGLANQVYATSTSYADPVSGSVGNLVRNLITEDNNLTSQYNTLVNQANDYTNFLLQQYGQMSAQMQAAGQTQTVLNAMFSADTSGGKL